MASSSPYKTFGQIGDDVRPISLVTQEQKDSLLSATKLVVVDLYGNWCGPCMAVAGNFAALGKTYDQPGLVALVKENVDLKLTKVKGVPAFLFFVEGKEVEDKRVMGPNMKKVEDTIIELCERLKIELPGKAEDAFKYYRERNPAIFPTLYTQGS